MSKEEENNLFDVDIDNVVGDEIDVSELAQDISTEGNEGNESDEGDNNPASSKSTDDNPAAEDGGIDIAELEETNLEDTSINSPESDSSSPLQLLANTLLDKGVIDIEDDTKVETAEDLIEAVRKTIASKELDDLTPSQKLYVESIRNGIPEEVVKTNLANMDALNSITEDNISANEKLRETLITQDFIAKGISEKQAIKYAKRSVDLGEDLDDAKEAYLSLKGIESKRLVDENLKIEESRKESAKKNEDRLSALKETILKKDDWIKDVKINSTTKENIFKNMTEVVDYKDGEGITAITKARLDNPEQFEMMESMMYTITKGFTDFSKLNNAAKTNSIKKLEQSLQTKSASGGAPKGISSSSGKGLMNALSKFD